MYFLRLVLLENGEINHKFVIPKLVDFCKTFGIDQIVNIEELFLEILTDQLAGYDAWNIKAKDIVHIGGPIVLIS